MFHLLIFTRQFFSGPLKQFERTRTWKSVSGKKVTGLMDADTIEAIGEGKSLVNPVDLYRHSLT